MEHEEFPRNIEGEHIEWYEVVLEVSLIVWGILAGSSLLTVIGLYLAFNTIMYKGVFK